jgi:DNA-binding GntR family transcriptional regulator
MLPGSLKPAKRASLGDTVADSLRDAILTGRFRPGDRIGQIMVAQELGVSQTTVRDAFATLEREGLVERMQNQGAVVVELSREDIEEIISLRTALEVMAIRRVVQHATAEQIDELEENIHTMQAVRVPERMAELDLEFHNLLVRFANHKRLLACWQSLLGQLRLLLLYQHRRDRSSHQGTIRNHRGLVQLLRARDQEGAVKHVEQQVDIYRVQVLTAEETEAKREEPRGRKKKG